MSRSYTKELSKYSEKLKILFVDDEDMVREIVEELLSDFFATFHTATNGKEAYEMYLENDYDIVLSDIMMPVMDGIELGTMIKKDNPDKVFIAISAQGESDYLLALTKIGTDGFIQKPVGASLFPALYKACKCIYLDKKDRGLIS